MGDSKAENEKITNQNGNGASEAKTESPPEGDVNSITKSNNLVIPDQILPINLFILPVNSPIIFPTLLAPLLIANPRLSAMIEEAISRQRMIGLLQMRGGEVREDNKADDLYTVGVVVKIIKRLKMPDGSVNLLVHSIKRFHVKKIISEQPYVVAEAEYLDDEVEKTTEMDAITRSVISYVKKLSEANPFFTEEMRLAMINAPGPGTVADLVGFALTLPKADAQDFLETLSVKTRFEKLLLHLKREQDLADVQKRINEEVNSKINKLQREFFLKEQLRLIRRELGQEEDGKDKALRSFKERIEAAGMPEEARKTALEELEKFQSISENSPEYNLSRNYLEIICSLPWNKETKDNHDLANAQTILDQEHYGLEKVKERIIEFLAVRKLKEDPKGSILCLVGPPGVGKTSLGKSIAKALGRTFYRFSLGGMRDEAEIKGHRRTYIGAMPGKVLQGLKRASNRNCVLMLDEVDKLGNSFHGDPASALLEVLDPEQNSAFLDHYLDIPFDLSRVLFITTANTTTTIPSPLLDRMEVIELPGYTLEEKEKIALKHVIPKEFESNGVKSEQLVIDASAIQRMMLDYAREPGLRSLQQMISRIARKAATKIVKNSQTTIPLKKKLNFPIRVTEDELIEWIGPKKYYNEVAERITSPGVMVGLAWTTGGGDILFIEATDIPTATGSGTLKITGQLGEVMSESAVIAWSYVKKKSIRDLGLDPKHFKNRDFHLHIPSGAIPKDGPSAGITMASALYSLLSGRKAKHRFAMTGEISLIGKVLPVGGIKEKLLAAKRVGITDVILPKLNEKDLYEIPDFVLKNLNLHFVSRFEDVLSIILEDNVSTQVKSQLKPRINKISRFKKLNLKNKKTSGSKVISLKKDANSKTAGATKFS